MESVRGPKGGHLLAKPPEQITVGEIVALLEEGTSLVECTEHAELCARSQDCPTRMIWQEAAQAMFDRLKAITLADLIERARAGNNQELNEVLNHPIIPVVRGKSPVCFAPDIIHMRKSAKLSNIILTEGKFLKPRTQPQPQLG